MAGKPQGSKFLRALRHRWMGTQAVASRTLGIKIIFVDWHFIKKSTHAWINGPSQWTPIHSKTIQTLVASMTSVYIMTTARWSLFLITSLLVLVSTTHAFVLPAVTRPFTTTTTTTQIAALTTSSEEIESARAAFALCFFGAVGSASLGRDAIPIVWQKFQVAKTLEGQGPTLGGPSLELPWITGYPTNAVSIADVQKVLDNVASTSKTNAQAIVQDYPLPNQPPGYLTYESFALANANQNPLAVRAVFESLAISSEILVPETAQQVIEEYRQDLLTNKDSMDETTPLQQLRQNLIQTKTLSASALFFLVSILGIADYFAIYHLYKGWFPDWPGFQNFPLQLFDAELGLAAIPQYWIS